MVNKTKHLKEYNISVLNVPKRFRNWIKRREWRGEGTERPRDALKKQHSPVNIAANLEVSMDIDGFGKKSLKKISETTGTILTTMWKESHIHIQADQNFVVIFEAYSTKDGSDSHVSLDDIKVLSGSCDDQKALDKPTEPGKRDLILSFPSKANP